MVWFLERYPIRRQVDTIEPTGDLLADNATIPAAENAGQNSRPFFEAVLADEFAFRRANGKVVNRSTFLDDLMSGGDRRVSGDHEILLPIRLVDESPA